ncbi:selenoprotein S [Aplysia californica]|uniref:Selenoprotein S n=1 Tax=Aplysia californica TaxID=6500 RepID=A0ABM0ZVK3_APLCA|nr:selenoprotein S [Aplysia californica]
MEEPHPKNEDPAFISAGVDLVVSTIQTYGWFVVALVLLGVYLASKLRPQLNAWREQRESGACKKTDVNAASSRMEAMQRARQRMQEQLDAQAKVFMEQQAEKEERQRQERLEDWERHQQGRGYRSKVKAPEAKPEPSKPPKSKKALRPGLQYRCYVARSSGVDNRKWSTHSFWSRETLYKNSSTRFMHSHDL